MTVAMISGFESSTDAEWIGTSSVRTTVTDGQWTWTITGTAARKGTYGFRVQRTGSAGSSPNGIQLQHSFSSQYPWKRPGNPGSLTLPVAFRFYVKIVTWPSTTLHYKDLCRLTLSNTSGQNVGISLSTGNRTLNVFQGTATGSTHSKLMNLSTATWYRVEGRLERSKASAEAVFWGAVYAETGTEPLASHEVTLSGTDNGGTTVVTAVNLGVISSIAGNPALASDLYFDDFRIDEGQTVGPGAVLAARWPTSDVTTEWTVTGSATHYQNVDEALFTNDGTDENHTITTGTVLRTDQLGLAAYGGANTVTALAALFRFNCPGGLPAEHEYGFAYSGSEEVEDMGPFSAAAAYASAGVVIDTAPGGGTLGSNWPDVLYRRKSIANVLNDASVSTVIVMIEDSDGVAWPPAGIRHRSSTS